MTFKFPITIDAVRNFLSDSLARISADTLAWMAAIVFHAATIPTLLALMSGLSDRTPSLDVVLFLWTGLALLFLRSVVLKDMLNIVTIGFGFIVQAVLMAMLLYR